MPAVSFRDALKALAAAPGDPNLFYACCTAREYEALDETIAMVRARLAQKPITDALRLNELHIFAHSREKQARRDAGLSVTNARGVDDLDFQFARAELEALTAAARTFLGRYASPGAAILLAESLVSTGRVMEAETVLAGLRAQGMDHVAAVTSFDDGLHAKLAALGASASQRLPPQRVLKPLPDGATRVVFTAADYLYFQKWGWDLVESFARHAAPGGHLALHIMDMTPAETEAAVARLDGYAGLSWALTTEWTNLRTPGPAANARARGYYHAGRLIRLHQLLTAHPNAAVWMLDTDMLVADDTQLLFTALEGCDAMLGLSPGRFEVRNKVCLSFTGFSAQARARDYLLRVVGYVAHFLEKGRLPWGIDQVAMYTVLVKNHVPFLRIASVPVGICDTSKVHGRVLWPAKPAR